MHTLCALSMLFLQSLLTVPTTVLSPSDLRNETSIASLGATNTASTVPIGLTSLPSSISLTFDLFGSQIPSSAVNAAFNGAITRIHPFLQSKPDEPIANDDFQYRAVGGSVQIGVEAILHHGVSWQQLNSVLRQAASFMNGDPGAGRQHMQELSFEIIEDGTKTGEGLVSYRPSRGSQFRDPTLINLTNAKDTKLLLAPTDPLLTAPRANTIPFRIPDTPFALTFDVLGDAIPILSVWAAFDGARSQIISPLGQHPSSPIPNDQFEHEEESVRITVLPDKGIIMTWKQLSWILGGMYAFMTGTPEHYQLLTCDIEFVGHEKVGSASVWYSRELA